LLRKDIEEVSSLPKPRPEGTFTIDEMAESFNMSYNQCRARLVKLVNAGKIEEIKDRGRATYFKRIDE
jgi:Fic family protein